MNALHTKSTRKHSISILARLSGRKLITRTKPSNFLNEQNIKRVPKSENTLEIRFIEDFWALIEGEVCKDDWKAGDLDQLRTRIRRFSLVEMR